MPGRQLPFALIKMQDGSLIDPNHCVDAACDRSHHKAGIAFATSVRTANPRFAKVDACREATRRPSCPRFAINTQMSVDVADEFDVSHVSSDARSQNESRRNALSNRVMQSYGQNCPSRDQFVANILTRPHESTRDEYFRLDLRRSGDGDPMKMP